MFRMLMTSSLAALLTACAAPSPTAANDPLPRGSTARGDAAAAEMGFHGPVYRANKADGPN